MNYKTISLGDGSIANSGTNGDPITTLLTVSAFENNSPPSGGEGLSFGSKFKAVILTLLTIAFFASCSLGMLGDGVIEEIIYEQTDPAKPGNLDIIRYSEGYSSVDVVYHQDGNGIHHNSLKVTVRNSNRDNPAGFVIPLADTIYKQNPNLTDITFSFPEMDSSEFEEFLKMTVLGLMDHDSHTREWKIQNGVPLDEFLADHPVYANLSGRKDILMEKYGIDINASARTITVNLGRRPITVNNISTDDAWQDNSAYNDFVDWSQITVANGRANFSVRARQSESDAGYIGVFLNYDSKNPDLNQTFCYNPNMYLKYDFDLNDQSADVLLVMSQIDPETGEVTGQLEYNLANDHDPIQGIRLDAFTQSGLRVSGDATVEVLQSGGLKMELREQDSSVTVTDQSEDKFSYNSRDDRNAYILVTVKDPNKDFISKVSVGLGGIREDNSQTVSVSTDPTNESFLNQIEPPTNLGNGYFQYKIPIRAMGFFPRSSIDFNSISFKNINDNSQSWDVSSISLHDGNGGQHNMQSPAYIDKASGLFGGLGFVILKGGAVSGSMGSFEIGYPGNMRKIEITETTHDFNSDVMRLSWTTHSAPSYTYRIETSAGDFKRQEN